MTAPNWPDISMDGVVLLKTFILGIVAVGLMDWTAG
jgi:hypothetical protein